MPKLLHSSAGKRVVIFDTAPLVELYHASGHHHTLAQQVYMVASVIAVCRLVLPEAHAAINAMNRNKILSRRASSMALAQIDKDWQRYLRLAVSVSVCEEAAKLTRLHALRGADAVHLAVAWYYVQFNPNALFFIQDKKLYQVAQKLLPVVQVPGF